MRGNIWGSEAGLGLKWTVPQRSGSKLDKLRLGSVRFSRKYKSPIFCPSFWLNPAIIKNISLGDGGENHQNLRNSKFFVTRS